MFILFISCYIPLNYIQPMSILLTAGLPFPPNDLFSSALFAIRFYFECLHFGLKNRGLLMLLLPDVSPASVAGIFRILGSWVVARSLLQQPRSQVL